MRNTSFGDLLVGALFQLRRKKMFDKEIDQIYGKRTNIEIQVMALRGAASNKDVLSAMRVGRDALKASVKESYVPSFCTGYCAVV